MLKRLRLTNLISTESSMMLIHSNILRNSSTVIQKKINNLEKK